MSRRLCFALDLHDDPALIAEYERMHAAVPAEITEDIRAQGILRMEIWRTADRLLMIVEVDDDYPRVQRDTAMQAAVDRWESLMWTFQRPLPHASAGEKWVPMKRIFELDESCP